MPPRNLLCVRTDSLCFQACARLATRVTEQLESLCFSDLANLRWLYERPLFDEERRPREQTRPARIDNFAHVFRIGRAKTAQGHHAPPVAEPWAFALPPEPRDVSLEEARGLVGAGQSLLILGPPASGRPS